MHLVKLLLPLVIMLFASSASTQSIKLYTSANTSLFEPTPTLPIGIEYETISGLAIYASYGFQAQKPGLSNYHYWPTIKYQTYTAGFKYYLPRQKRLVSSFSFEMQMTPQEFGYLNYDSYISLEGNYIYFNKSALHIQDMRLSLRAAKQFTIKNIGWIELYANVGAEVTSVDYYAVEIGRPVFIYILCGPPTYPHPRKEGVSYAPYLGGGINIGLGWFKK